ncbi:MAG TPA: response regulator [Geminicoccaceae bacterium]|nr:response regulator [Geminicoccaceae bacterium]
MPDGIPAPQHRILLAEEQAAARDLLRLGLDRLNCRIESVESAGDALAEARRDPADLVLLSATLPDMPGAPLIDAIRSLPGLERVPIVAIHDGDPEVERACMAAGAAACLCRPLDPEILLSSIERLLRSGAWGSSREPAVDLNHLDSFTDGDRQLEGELSALFLSMAEMYLREMREALAAGRAWTSSAHALKGASGNLGARRLAALALDAERSEPSQARLEAIEQALSEVRAFFGSRAG